MVSRKEKQDLSGKIPDPRESPIFLECFKDHESCTFVHDRFRSKGPELPYSDKRGPCLPIGDKVFALRGLLFGLTDVVYEHAETSE